MDNIITRYLELPPGIRAFTVRDRNGDYNIYINAHLSAEACFLAYIHELNHINSGDFDSLENIHFLEERAAAING